MPSPLTHTATRSIRSARLLAGVSASLLVTVTVMLSAGSASAMSARTAALRNPAHNCHARYFNPAKLSLRAIDRCRAQEGLGSLELPNNYRRLRTAQRMFVLVNLARVNRGLAPIVGLSATLDRIARSGANSESDPGFPTGYFSRGGALWAYTRTLTGADDDWMFDDGWGRSVSNWACTSPHAPGCWMHRDVILMRSRQRLVAGGGARPVHERGMSSAHSYAFEILAGYSRAHLSFTWRRELRYFTQRPGLDLLASSVAKYR